MKKLLPKSINNPKGFTLVELLVVISIIAILSVIGITVFTGVQKNARDGRRKSDLEAISKALEVNYNSSTGAYPAALSTTYFSSGIIPTDPKGASSPYVSSMTTSNYTLCASLETSTGNATNSTGTM